VANKIAVMVAQGRQVTDGRDLGVKGYEKVSPRRRIALLDLRADAARREARPTAVGLVHIVPTRRYTGDRCTTW
jgi:hypothetical protein